MNPRLTLTALLALSIGIAAVVSAPPALAADKLRVTAIQGTQLFPVRIMQSEGIAAKHGLDLEVKAVAGPQALYTILQTNDFDVAFGGWISIALMRDKGFKFTNVYSMISFTNEIMVKNDSPVKSIADLKGKRIGLFGGPTAATSWLFRVLAVKRFGFDPVKEAKLHYGAPPLLVGMLDRGDLDAILILDPFITQSLETGNYRSVASVGDLWRETTGQSPMLVAVTVYEPWAKANPDVVRRFVAAFKEAMVYLKEHPAAWAPVAKQMGIKTDKGVRLLYERTAPAFITTFDQKLIDDQLAYAAEIIKAFGPQGDVPAKIPEGTFDLSFVK